MLQNRRTRHHWLVDHLLFPRCFHLYYLRTSLVILRYFPVQKRTQNRQNQQSPQNLNPLVLLTYSSRLLSRHRALIYH